ncbi:MAG: 16S rRNA (guanine(527)-N(7))-methyltransferase RsmG [Desulfobulbaceae bacterium]
MTGNNDDAGRAAGLLHEGLAALHLAVSPEAVEQLVAYLLELRKWNRRINLVSRGVGLDELVEKHFLDSLLLLHVLDQYPRTQGGLLDVGSGAGFPGLPLKVARPALPVTLLEPRQRRCAFLRHMARYLGLRGLEVIEGRTDDPVLEGKNFAVITGRGVADVVSFLTMVRDLAAVPTLVVCMQGASARQQWVAAGDIPGFERAGIERFQLPFSGARRGVLLFRKT